MVYVVTAVTPGLPADGNGVRHRTDLAKFFTRPAAEDFRSRLHTSWTKAQVEERDESTGR